MESTRIKKMEDLGIRIFQNCRNELFLQFPYLDGAFASVSYEADWQIFSAGTDGETFYFSPEYVLKTYADHPEIIRRGYLHMLLHCLFLHLFQETDRSYPEEIRNLAFDMSVEFFIRNAAEENGCKRMMQNQSHIRAECFRIIDHELPSGVSVQNLCEMLVSGVFPYPEEEMESAFLFDDHCIWKRNGLRARNSQKRKWEEILTYISMNRAASQKRRGTKAGNDKEDLTDIRKSDYDYRSFLKRFSIPGEELELDMDSFDYIYYHLGLERYGNLPLMEPLEYKEVNKLEELVIAIDTSGSCSAETVRKFLEETYAIVSEKENFFRKMRVILIQCDCCIQSIVVLHSEEEWREYSQKITICGRGGTDFRPVFRYVKEQRQEGKLKKLRALIYLTDGDGIYPDEKTDYEAAFVFLERTEKMKLVPAWALRLVTETGGR